MSFASKIRTAFLNVKLDIANIQEKLNSWVMHLNNDTRDLRLRIMELENRVKELETIHHVRKKR